MKIFVKLGVIAAFVSLFTFVACKKDETSQLANNSKKYVEVIHEYRANTDKLEDLIQKTDNEYETYINKSNVEICNVLKDLVTREDVNRFIVETAKANNGDISFELLFGKFPELKSLFQNTVIGKRNGSNSLTSNSDEEYDFVYNDIAYKSMLFVPNAEICKPSDKSILSPEIQIYRETGEGDIYFAWDVKKDKKEKEINIIEKEAMSTTVPMIVTSLKHVAFLKPANLKVRTSEEAYTSKKRSNRELEPRICCEESVWVRRANCLHNYDGGTNIELHFTGAFISDDGLEVNWVRSGSGTTWQASDHTQTCSLILTNDDHLYTKFNPNGNNPNFWINKKYFVNFYERDWGSSNKPLGKAVYAGKEAPFEGRRKYTNEWYLYHPSRVQNFVDAVPMNTMFNNPGQEQFPTPDQDFSANDCGTNNNGLKIDVSFTRGWQ